VVPKVEASERWRQLERRLEALAKATSGAALRGDRPLIAAGPLSEPTPALAEEDAEEDTEEGKEEACKACISPDENRKARKAQRRARMKERHKQRQSKANTGGNGNGSNGDWWAGEATRLRSAFAEAAAAAAAAGDCGQPRNDATVVAGLPEAVTSLNTAVAALGLLTSNMADAAAFALSRSGRAAVRRVEQCCGAVRAVARAAWASGQAASTWEVDAVRALARAAALAATVDVAVAVAVAEEENGRCPWASGLRAAALGALAVWADGRAADALLSADPTAGALPPMLVVRLPTKTNNLNSLDKIAHRPLP
jgi:hypothetical protein